MVLAEAVRVQVITSQAAGLIAATRPQGVPLADYAKALGVPPKRLYSRRERAESRLAAAIAEGHVSVNALGLAQNPGR